MYYTQERMKLHTLSGDTLLQQSIDCALLCPARRQPTTLSGETAADSLLRSSLSVKTMLQPTIRFPPLCLTRMIQLTFDDEASDRATDKAASSQLS
jgi:hypothetical protein